MLFDTITIKHFVPGGIPDEYLRDIGAIVPTGKNRTFVINPTKDNYQPSITFKTTPDKVTHMSMRFSAARYLFGHNAALADALETFGALFPATEYFQKRTGIPFEPLTAIVAEIHFAKDIQVGEDRVIPVIRKLSDRIVTNHTRLGVDDTGVYFKQKSSSVVCYSKFHEVLKKQPQNHEALDISRGKLRLEVRLLSRAIQNLDYRTTTRVITESLSERFINRAIDRLALYDTINKCVGEPVLDQLLTNCKSVTTACRLFGFHTLVKTRGQDCWRDEQVKMGRTTYFNNLRELRAIGVLPEDES